METIVVDQPGSSQTGLSKNRSVARPYSERIGMLKDRVMSRHYQTDIERAKYVTRAYKSTEGQPPCMRAARGLEETLRHMTIRIEDGERIVGSKTAKAWGGPIFIERSPENMYVLLSTQFYKKPTTIAQVFPNGVAGVSAEFLREVSNISEEEYRELTEEIIPYWSKNCIGVYRAARWKEAGLYPNVPISKDLPQQVIKSLYIFNDTIMFVDDAQGHVTVGIKKVLDMGFKGIARQAAERLARLTPDEKDYERRKDFLESVQVTSAAVCEFAERYARLAEEMAVTAAPERKIELLEIAKRCRQVPAEPPRNFIEALQAVWLTQAVVIISCGDASITCPGRIDQFVYPYYQQDWAAGRITRDQALEAIEEYYIKLATNIYFGPNNVTIGGVDKHGDDATNEVSYLFLEAHKNLKGLRNGLAVRTSPKTPREFILKALGGHRDTAGVAFYNDYVVIRDLMSDGYSLEDARNYSIVGCVEPTGTGNNNGYTSSNGIFPVTILEMALNEGGRSVTNWQRVGLATPPAREFKTFEDVKKAYADQMAYTVDLAVQRGRIKDQVIADYFPTPLVSSTIEGCIESGQDITRGGARYNHGAISGQALATVANSLAAIKWAVFDKKLLTMEELVKHLHDNFQGAEEVRQQLLKAPKFGNDDPYVDELAAWVADVYNCQVVKHKFWHGGTHRACLISALSQDAEGLICGATPDGRLAGTAVSNGMSPSNGTDGNGMTAALRSAASVSSVPVSCGTSFNITFNPSNIKTDENLTKLESVVEGYFALGGRHVQFNPISREMLKDAQIHPENYSELNVKVSGFSMRFIDLPKSLQDDIIARTQYAGV
jgi:pyruvate formate-lyase/glycerol dehydratase family glycyl radical enzyme